MDVSAILPNETSADSDQLESDFEGASGCDIDAQFAAMSLVIDTTFCGGWAGNSFEGDSVCKGLASSCTNYVAGNPSAFEYS
jgi:hypothetical protein